jgi:hypothetical protein
MPKAGVPLLSGSTVPQLRLISSAKRSLPGFLLAVAAPFLLTSFGSAEAARVAGAPKRQLPSVVTAPSAGGTLTAFESGEYLATAADQQTETLMGLRPQPWVDLTPDGLAIPNDPGTVEVQFQGGDPSQRWADIVSDPTRPDNHALGFFLRAANVSGDEDTDPKGRVQLNAYDPNAMHAREIRFSTRMYLPADVGLLSRMNGTIDWLTVSEWWNDAGWTGQPYPFRVSVNIVKPVKRSNTPLYFQARAQSMDLMSRTWSRTVWQVTNRSVPVPIGKWITLEYSYLEGNATTGRFYLAMTPDGGSRKVLVDIRSWTHHPENPAPDGVTHVNPLKLYTSKPVIDYVRNAGGVLSIYWDDPAFRLCAERGPENSSPCAPASFQ